VTIVKISYIGTTYTYQVDGSQKTAENIDSREAAILDKMLGAGSLSAFCCLLARFTS
jgi:hypothetical protein